MRNQKTAQLPRTKSVDARWNTAPVEIGHRGHGPKSYTRSDERIYEDVCELLTRHDAIDAREIEVTVVHGDVTLRGTVATKQMKETAARSITDVVGVKTTHDALRVEREDVAHA